MSQKLETFDLEDSLRRLLRRVRKPRQKQVFKRTSARRTAIDRERKIAALMAATRLREPTIPELESAAHALIDLHAELLRGPGVPQCVRELAFNPDAKFNRMLVIGVEKDQRTTEDPFWIAYLDKPLGEYDKNKRLTGTWVYTGQKSRIYKIGDLPLDEDSVPRSSILGGIQQLPKTAAECVLFREHMCRLFPRETSA